MPYPTTTDYVFTEGLDPTSIFTAPEATALLSFLRVATPNDYYGMVIHTTTTPATSGQPSGYPTDWYAWNKRNLWHNPTTNELFGYKTGFGFEPIALADGSVDTDALADDAVTVDKVAPGAALQLLRTNTGGTAVEWAGLSSILTAGSVPVSAVSPTGASAINSFFRSNGTSNYWGPLTVFDINLAIPTGGLAITKLNQGTARQVLRMRTDAAYAEWIAPTGLFDDNELPLTKLSPGSGNANKAAYVNAAGTALEFRTPPSAPTIAQFTSTSLTVPATGATTTAAHGLASRPTVWGAYFVCTTGEAGYSIGDEVAANEVDGVGAGGDHGRGYTASVSATTFSLVSTTGWASVQIGHKTTGAFTTFTPANWALVFRGQIITP
jgi:hypothetical protein